MGLASLNDKSAIIAQEAVALAPNSPVVLDPGHAAVENGEKAKGLENLRKAVSLGPKLPQLRIPNLAKALAANGDKDGARKELDERSKNAPESAIRNEIDKPAPHFDAINFFQTLSGLSEHDHHCSYRPLATLACPCCRVRQEDEDRRFRPVMLKRLRLTATLSIPHRRSRAPKTSKAATPDLQHRSDDHRRNADSSSSPCRPRWTMPTSRISPLVKILRKRRQTHEAQRHRRLYESTVYPAQPKSVHPDPRSSRA